MLPPLRIVLSGGGVKVISLLGSLQVLAMHGYLANVQEYCGVSAGAWLAFLLAAGSSIETLEKLILDLDFSVIRNLNLENLVGLPELLGVDDGLKLVKFLESIIRVVLKQDSDLTFEGLAALPGAKRFRCWATDLNTRSPREFSLAETPTVRIVDALRASMSLPLYFVPVKDPLTGNLLGDGGIHGNLPLHHLTPLEIEHTIALGFCHGETKKDEPPSDLMQFMNAILSCIVQVRLQNLMAKWPHKLLLVPVEEYPSWNFELGRDDRQMLLAKGKAAAEAWIANPPPRPIEKRRASI
jgi:predicted acylesterase/phospholipase RssA